MSRFCCLCLVLHSLCYQCSKHFLQIQEEWQSNKILRNNWESFSKFRSIISHIDWTLNPYNEALYLLIQFTVVIKYWQRNTTRLPLIWVQRSPIRTMFRTPLQESPLPSTAHWKLYFWLGKHCEQFVSGSNPIKHPVCTSGLWISTFDPYFTPIKFSVKKQHQLLYWMFSTATPVHWI